jgi:hypothetical protein
MNISSSFSAVCKIHSVNILEPTFCVLSSKELQFLDAWEKNLSSFFMNKIMVG